MVLFWGIMQRASNMCLMATRILNSSTHTLARVGEWQGWKKERGYGFIFRIFIDSAMNESMKCMYVAVSFAFSVPTGMTHTAWRRR